MRSRELNTGFSNSLRILLSSDGWSSSSSGSGEPTSSIAARRSASAAGVARLAEDARSCEGLMTPNHSGGTATFVDPLAISSDSIRARGAGVGVEAKRRRQWNRVGEFGEHPAAFQCEVAARDRRACPQRSHQPPIQASRTEQSALDQHLAALLATEPPAETKMTSPFVWAAWPAAASATRRTSRR